jgi:hypothetical protein
MPEWERIGKANWLVVLSTMTLVAGLDYATGYELGFFVFYFLPVALAAWRLGRFPAAATAVLAAMVWFWMDALGGHVYRSHMVAVWNTVIRLLSFLVIAWGVSWIGELLSKERQISANLRQALAEIKILEGILPICASCKKIRNQDDRWQQLEVYISAHTKAHFSHGLCPECAKRCLEEAKLAIGLTKNDAPPEG